MRIKVRTVAAATAIALGATGTAVAVAQLDGSNKDRSIAIKQQINPKKPRNVILIVGDGMSDSELTLGKYYSQGAGGKLNLEQLPFTGSLDTWNIRAGEGPDYQPNYVPDSAPTATAWSTGKKTIDGRLSQGPSTAAEVPGTNEGYRTTFEIAKARGLRTGNVSTAELSDATPAAPVSHISQRGCQGPEDARKSCASETKGEGGAGSIVEQAVDHNVDVMLGGGRARFEQPLDSGEGNVIDYATRKGYRVLNDAEDLSAVQGLGRGPVLGLFAAGNMTTEYKPLIAAPTPGAGSETTRCEAGNRPGNEPSLASMTSKAINLLDRRNDKGFFLQVEGASVDKRNHAADVCGQIGETVALDRAVGVALEYQEENPDTLVVVTADHSHTSQIVPPTSEPAGNYATLQTADQAPIRVSYGTAKDPSGQSHTGARIPVAAIGPQAANVLGNNDQTDLFATLIGRDRGDR